MFRHVLDCIRPHEITPREHWIPDDARTTCAMCNERFSLFRHKHHCRTCGDVVCMDCVTKKVAVSPTADPANVIVCVLCLARRERQFLFQHLSVSVTSPQVAVDFNHPFQNSCFSDAEASHDGTTSRRTKPSKRPSFFRTLVSRTFSRW
ncbi:hypothetical protein AaE_008224 [Aphanomyces astaci]|uniref:FYVE-type domain-containing protein n=1 Tax=Aphanomyces astaci TaxID=112090 RepID=A0A6A4ZVE1_APHAT|nr:hypothetical protein AaE_008224 [Aphanomyces astaci]